MSTTQPKAATAQWLDLTQLTTPRPTKPQDRKVWGLGLEAIWLPFLTATNVDGTTNISPDALGAPVRLARQRATGAIRRRADGSAATQVVTEISASVRLIRDNFGSGLQAYSAASAKAHPEAHKQAYADAAAARAGCLAEDATALALESELEAAMTTPTTPTTA